MYWIRLRISDHTTTTTCSIFDDDAKKRILKKTITILLESLNGESEEVPKIIEQLYGKALIF